jgi:hypothetical protein
VLLSKLSKGQGLPWLQAGQLLALHLQAGVPAGTSKLLDVGTIPALSLMAQLQARTLMTCAD